MNDKVIETSEEKELESFFKRLVYMDYPLCPLCSSRLIPLKGSKWIAFVVCSNEKKCGRMWDKYELLGAYISAGKYIAQELVEKWWRELIDQMKIQNQHKEEEE